MRIVRYGPAVILLNVLFMPMDVGASGAGREQCVWIPGTSTDEISGFLKEWSRDHDLGEEPRFTVRMQGVSAALVLATSTWSLDLELLLGARCTTDPTVRVKTTRGRPGLSEESLDDLARRIPMEKKEIMLEATEEGHVILPIDPFGGGAGEGEIEWVGPAWLQMASMWAVILVVLLAVIRRRPERLSSGRPHAVDLAAVLLLLTVSALPFRVAPISYADGFSRVWYMASNPFGDPGHPFLPFILSMPASFVSLDPLVLRIIPFLFLAGETVLLMFAASARSGRLAGIVAGAWFACEVRYRHGLLDFSDWDFAGFFLMAALLWTVMRDRSSRERPRLWPALAILLAGVLCSYLMVVPGVVLLGCLLVGRDRKPLNWKQVSWLALFVLALVFIGVRIIGWIRMFSPMPFEWDLYGLLILMMRETPILRTGWMALPLIMGIAFLVPRWRRLPERFTTLTILGVAAGIVIIHVLTNRAQGYYFGLVTPLVIWICAVGLSEAWQFFVRTASVRLDGQGRKTVVTLTSALVVLLMTLTVFLPQYVSGWKADGLHDLTAFDRAVTGDDRFIVTNNKSVFLKAMGYDRARRKEALPDAIKTGPEDMRERILGFDFDECAPIEGYDSSGTPFYVAAFWDPDKNPKALGNCLGKLGVTCEPMFPHQGSSKSPSSVLPDKDQYVRFLRCRKSQ